MVADPWQAGLINWFLTYLLHSTILLSGIWFITSLLSNRYEALKEVLWKFALVGGLFSATLQVGFQAPSYAKPFDLALLSETSPGIGIGNIAQPDLVDATDADARGIFLEEVAGSAQMTSAQSSSPDGMDHRSNAILDLPPTWTWFSTLPSRLTASLLPIAPWIALAIILGTLLGILLNLESLRRILSGRAIIHDERLVSLFNELCTKAGVKQRVRLTRSARLASPLAMGILRPEICLPQRAMDSLGDAEIESMLAHELAHIVRRDPQWMMLSQVLKMLLFFQPLNRVAGRQLRELAEYQCDAWAAAHCGDSISLARCLTEVASWLVQARSVRQTSLWPGMSVHQTSLSRRVGRLLDEAPSYEQDRQQKALALAIVPVMLGAIALTPAVRAVTSEIDHSRSAPLMIEPTLDDHLEFPTVPMATDRDREEASAAASLRALNEELAWLADAIDELKMAPAVLVQDEEFRTGLELLEQKINSITNRRDALLRDFELHLPVDSDEFTRNRYAHRHSL